MSPKANKPERRKPGQRIPNRNRQASPAEQLVRDLEGGPFFMLGEVAEIIGVAKSTLRRLVTADPPVVNAPSYTKTRGAMTVYVFDKSDIDEIKSYYKTKYEDFAGPGTSLPTGRPKARKT